MDNTATAKPTARPNTYAGLCSRCAERVAAGDGILGAKVDGRWTVLHATCPTLAAGRTSARTYAVECDNGHRRHVDGCNFCRDGVGF